METDTSDGSNDGDAQNHTRNGDSDDESSMLDRLLERLQDVSTPSLSIFIWSLLLSYLMFCVIYVSSVVPWLRQQATSTSEQSSPASDSIVDQIQLILFEIGVSWFYFSFATPCANMWFARLSQLFFNRVEKEARDNGKLQETQSSILMHRIYLLANVGFAVVKFFFGRGLLIETTSTFSLLFFVVKNFLYDVWHFGYSYSDVGLLANERNNGKRVVILVCTCREMHIDGER